MKLISIQAELAPQGKASVLSLTPFLGGVLHGVVEHLLREHLPHLSSDLGLENEAPRKRYAILPPPFGTAHANASDGPMHLGFGIMLYGEATQHDQAINEALTHWQEIRLAGHIDKVTRFGASTHVPGNPPPGAAQHQLSLEWLTPLMLDSPGQRETGASNAPPQLLRLVRSLVRRITQLEPDLAHQLALNTQAWIAAEEAIRQLPMKAQLEQVSWTYGSRTKARPIQLKGQIGNICFGTPESLIPSEIHSLVQWGTLFGIGQRTALGQGHYQITSTLPVKQINNSQNA